MPEEVTPSDKAQELVDELERSAQGVSGAIEWGTGQGIANAELQVSRNELLSYITRLETVVTLAHQLHIPAKYSYRYVDPPPAECPHGNIPRYPTHAWWCDGCFLAMEDALEALGFDLHYPKEEMKNGGL